MRVRVLGGCEIEAAEGRIALRFRQAELVGLLAVRQGRIARATAAALMWPDADPSSARHNLRQTLVALRGSGVSCVASEGESLSLSNVSVDLWELEERLSGDFAPQPIEELLPDIHADWLAPARGALVRSIVAACLREGDACLKKDPSRALAYADVALSQDPWLESARGLRVRALLASGARGLAEREVAAFERDLQVEGRSRLRDLVAVENDAPLPGISLDKLSPNERVRLLTALAPALGVRVQPLLTQALAESPGLSQGDRARAHAVLAGLALEHGNVALAEEHARSGVASARLGEAWSTAVLSLTRVLIVTDRGGEAEELLNAALRDPTDLSPEQSSALLSARAAARARRLALNESERDSRAAMALAREAACARLIGKAHYNLASAALWAGRFDAAQREAEAGLAVVQGIDPLEAGAFALLLGRIQQAQGFWNTAGASYRQGIDRIREVIHPTRLAQGLTMSADLDRRRGDLESAERSYREAVGLWRTLGDRLGLGTALKGLGVTLHAQGDRQGAERLLREATDAYLAGSDPLGGASAMLPLAHVLFEDGRADEALPYARRATERLRGMRAPASGVTSDETLSFGTAQRLVEEIGEKLAQKEIK